MITRSLALSLAVCAVLLSGHGISADGPMLEPQCDARMIANYARTMPIAEYLIVIDFVHKGGAIDDRYAAHLRELIAEAYAVQDIESWVKQRCAP